MRAAICSGSFDPITLGHYDIIQRAAACFDKVWVCVSPNAEKRNQMFAPEQKLQMVQAAVADLPNVEAEGVRCAADFDVEYQLAQINRGIHPGLDTVLLPASPAYQHFSSSMAREMIRYHQPLERYLPTAIIPLVRRIMEEKGE